MKIPNTLKYPLIIQISISIGLVVLTSLACFFSAEFIGYRVTALLLLMTVSIIAMLFDIFPVLLAAILSAISWNFFFIPPIFTFHISKTEDLLMFSLYFFIALVHAVLTYKIRQSEKKSRDKEEKEKTIKLYNTLLNSLSHELRTPIATIIGAVDTLREQKDKLNPKLQAELYDEINTAGLRLNRQVENLLNMSRLESGMLKPRLDWCDVNEIVNSEIQKNQGFDHSISFSQKENLPLFKLDSGLLEHILHNLIHNAVLYTPANSTIEIEVAHEVDACKIIVKDNGNGFTEIEMQSVFDKFYRLPNTKAGGSGLGLSIVKGFVEAQNGSILLENNQEGGAKFIVRIPSESSYINSLKNE